MSSPISINRRGKVRNIVPPDATIYDVTTYGADITGVLDSKAAFVAALAAFVAGGGYGIYVPPGTYKISSNLTFDVQHVVHFAYGAELRADNAVSVFFYGRIETSSDDQQIFENVTNANYVFYDSREVNVSWFGVDTTGAVNSATLLNRVLAMAERVYFPAGDYLVNGVVTAATTDTFIFSDDAQLVFGLSGGLVMPGQIVASPTAYIFDCTTLPDAVSGLRTVEPGWFGVTHDGVTNDAAALEALFSSIAEGTEIKLLGTCLINSTVTLPVDRTRVVGGKIYTAAALEPAVHLLGAEVVLKDLIVEYTSTSWDSSLATDRAAVLVSGDHCHLQNVVVLGGSTGIYLDLVTGTKIESCRAENSWLTSGQADHFLSSAIHVNGGTGNFISGWTAVGYGQGILGGARSASVTVTGANLSATTNNGVYVSSGDGWALSNVHAKNMPDGAGVKVRGRNHVLSAIHVDTAQLGIVVSPYAALPDPTLDAADITYATARGGLPANYYINGGNIALNGFTLKNIARHGLSIDETTVTVSTMYGHGITISNGVLTNVATEVGYSGILGYGDGVSLNNIVVEGYGTSGTNHGCLIVGVIGAVSFKDLSINQVTLRSPSSLIGFQVASCDNVQFTNNRTDATSIAFRFSNIIGAEVSSNRGLGTGTFRFQTLCSGVKARYNRTAGALVFTVVPTTSRFTENDFSSSPADVTNEYQWNANPQAGDIGSSFTFNSTFQNFAFGRAAYTVDDSIPGMWQRDRVGNSIWQFANATATGAALVQLAADSCSGSFGAWSLTNATVRRQDRVGVSLNSTAAGILMEATAAGQDITYYLGSTTRTARMSSDGLVSKQPISTKTAAYTVTVDDHTLLADMTAGAFSLTLPAAASVTGQKFVFKKTSADANVLTVAGTIDGVVNWTTATQWDTLRIQSDGTAYFKV